MTGFIILSWKNNHRYKLYFLTIIGNQLSQIKGQSSSHIYLFPPPSTRRLLQDIIYWIPCNSVGCMGGLFISRNIYKTAIFSTGLRPPRNLVLRQVGSCLSAPYILARFYQKNVDLKVI